MANRPYDPYIDQRIATTRANLKDAQKAHKQSWIEAEEGILRDLLNRKADQEKSKG